MFNQFDEVDKRYGSAAKLTSTHRTQAFTCEQRCLNTAAGDFIDRSLTNSLLITDRHSL